MTTQEFSAEFDILYNNIASNQAPGLDEYEKSVFLTKAQEELVKNYFNPLGNKYQQGYGDSSKRNINLDKLVEVAEVLLDSTFSNTISIDIRSLTPATYPKALFVLGETVLISNHETGINKRCTVVELSPGEYSRLMLRPYARPTHTSVWKITGSYDHAIGRNNFEYILPVNAEHADLYIRYVKYPKPIVLEELEGISINGVTEVTECELDEGMHSEILQRAVELAKASYVGDTNSMLELGKRSE